VNWPLLPHKNSKRTIQNIACVMLTFALPLSQGNVNAEPLSLLNWERIDFFGANKISVDENIIHMDSDNSASAYYYRFPKPISQPFTLAWSWRTSSVFSPETKEKNRDDYAARVYVVFNDMLSCRSLNYVLVDKKPNLDHWSNPYSSKFIMIPIGLDFGNAWQDELVHPWQDYQKIFNEYPSKAIGIAVMSDTDNTGLAVKAWYKDIEIDLLE